MGNDVVGRITFNNEPPVVKKLRGLRKRYLKNMPLKGGLVYDTDTLIDMMEAMGYNFVNIDTKEVKSCKGCKYEDICEDGDECLLEMNKNDWENYIK